MNSNVVAVLEVAAIFVLPIVVLATGWVPIGLRHWLGVPVLILLLASIKRTRWGWRKLGIRTDNFKSGLLPYAILTMALVVSIVILAQWQGRSVVPDWLSNFHFQYFFLLTSFFQEFAYRGYLVPKLESVFKSSLVQVLINGVLFSGLHYFFPNPELILPATFVIGVIFIMVYKAYPNLLLISLAHSAVNFVAVLFCYGSLDTSCIKL